VKGTHFSIKFLLGSILMLHSLTALAQGEADDDLGADPGLPFEAPATQAPASTPPGARPAPSATLPAPNQEGLVQPYESTPPATAPMPKTAPAPKARPAITGKLAELNLSAEQTQQIIDIRRQWKPDAEKRLKEDFAFLKQNLAQAMADNSSGEEVRRRFELMQRKYLELQTMKFEKLLRIREVLTPEQRKKFAELRSRPGRNNNNDND
jgi:Spy/CpxP family protein refolding chaperone